VRWSTSPSTLALHGCWNGVLTALACLVCPCIWCLGKDGWCLGVAQQQPRGRPVQIVMSVAVAGCAFFAVVAVVCLCCLCGDFALSFLFVRLSANCTAACTAARVGTLRPCGAATQWAVRLHPCPLPAERAADAGTAVMGRAVPQHVCLCLCGRDPALQHADCLQSLALLCSLAYSALYYELRICIALCMLACCTWETAQQGQGSTSDYLVQHKYVWIPSNQPCICSAGVS
jgi:hypothetical protein